MARSICKIVFLGPQGSGKGTQAESLAAKLKVANISTGNIYRAEIDKKTILGDKVASYYNQGRLVPDDITNALVEKRLGRADCRGGFILDGYPRTFDQAESLEKIVELTHAILIDISDRQAVYRIAGRVMCRCGASYHHKFKPPKKEGICDKCGAKLFIRNDDKEEVALRKRLAIYREQIDPILKLYKQKGILCQINGEQSIDDVFGDILKIFKQDDYD